MSEPTPDTGDAARLIRVLGPAARPIVSRLPPAELETLLRADPGVLRRPQDAALSAIACGARAADDPTMASWAGVFTLRFLALLDELAEADRVLRAAGVQITRAPPEEDVLLAMVDLGRRVGDTDARTLSLAVTAVAQERWTPGPVTRAMRSVAERLRREARDGEANTPAADRTPAYGLPALGDADFYQARVTVRRIDTAARPPRTPVDLEVGNGLIALVDATSASPFFADSLAGLANVVVTQVTGGGEGVRLQFERPDRTVLIDIVPTELSPDRVAHAVALLAERSRARR